MTTRSPTPRPDDALITPAPVPAVAPNPYPDLLTWPALPFAKPLPEAAQEGPIEVPEAPDAEVPAAADEAPQTESDRATRDDAPQTESDPAARDDVPPDDALPYGDPLPGLVQAAVADRPVEDVVRLITLLEGSPEHARTTADALRAVGVDRSVEDLARFVTLLTESPGATGSADEAIRAAAERRPLDDVSRLMQLLHRTSLGPHCGQAAVRAVAVSRPVEELAELIGRLSADRAVRETPLSEPPAAAPLGPVRDPVPAEAVSAFDAWAAATSGRQTRDEQDRPEKDRSEKDRPARARPAKERLAKDRSAKDRSARERLVQEWRARTGFAKQRSVKDRSAQDPDRNRNRNRDRWRFVTPEWGARAAALLVLLCGVAHAPRHWAGPFHGVLAATVLASGLCVLLALALPTPAAHARLVAGTAGFGVTAALAVGQLAGVRFGLPDAARLWGATLAPPWLAVTVAGTAALATLAVLLGALLTGTARREGAG
ncbi:hypothetical protein AB0L75_42335 [Streptomyces sp. NPDC052101]|uniref:hypothetical protein n=1 Tax=Streptomyces sp. NPDC052101 TaxID=3155763 RepID=UPI003419B767